MAPGVVAERNASKPESYSPKQVYQHYSIPRNPKKESERLRTFITWTVGFLDPRKLAKSGFYYTNVDDIIRCAFCGVDIGCWVEGEDPDADHKRLKPNCPFLTGQDCGNQPLSENGEEGNENEDEENGSLDVCGSQGLEIRPFSAPERPGKVPFVIESSNLWRDFEELGVSKISGPVSPYYATYISRLNTYENWKSHDVQSPEKLAEAGFYYTSIQDNVLCFHCGGGLKNWEKEDDPWVEHARYFYKCGFVILTKGRAFVQEVLLKKKNQSAVPQSSAEPEERSEVRQLKENPSKERSESKPKTVSPSVSSNSLSEKSESQSSSKSQNSDSKEEIELCRICYQRERGIVFLPCGHFVSCTQCAPSLSTCAVCRKPFEATVRAYLS